MKRDMDVIRAILLLVEDAPAKGFFGAMTLPDIDHDIVDAHVELLIDSGYLKGKILKAYDAGNSYAQLCLTAPGHDFLADTKSPDIWEKTKSAMAKIGVGSLAVAGQLAKEFAQKAIAAHLGLKPD